MRIRTQCHQCDRPKINGHLCEACRAEKLRLAEMRREHYAEECEADVEFKESLIPIYAQRAERKLPLFEEDGGGREERCRP